MPNLGGWELVILIGILVLLFGAKRLPDMARSIGQSARVFKGEMKGMKNDDEAEAPTRRPTRPPQPDTAGRSPQSRPPARPRSQAKVTEKRQPSPPRATQPGRGSTSAQ